MKKLIALIFILILVIIAGLYLKPIFYPRRDKKEPIIKPHTQIRLEVINSCGVAKAGKSAQDFLRGLGFDVYQVKTGQYQIEKTMVIDRLSREAENAQIIGDALKKRERKLFLSFIPLPWYKEFRPVVAIEIDSTLYLEATVILGKDYNKFFPKPGLLF